MFYVPTNVLTGFKYKFVAVRFRFIDMFHSSVVSMRIKRILLNTVQYVSTQVVGRSADFFRICFVLQDCVTMTDLEVL